MLHMTVACYFSILNLVYIITQSLGFKPGAVTQSPGFKPDTVPQSPGFKPDTVPQSTSFKPGTVSQSLGFKPGTIPQSPGFKTWHCISKAQALNLALTPFNYLIFKHKLSKIQSKQPTILSSKNYVTLILYP